MLEGGQLACDGPQQSDCEHDGVSGWPIQLLQHAPLLRQAICRVVQRRSLSTLVEVSPDRQACFFYGAFGPTFGVNNEPATMDRLIPRFVTFPQPRRRILHPVNR